MDKMMVNVGKGIEVECDFDRLPPNVQSHIVYLGWRNCVMDSHANVTEEKFPDAAERDAAANECVNKKVAALYAGEVRAPRVGGTRTSDPVMARVKDLARKWVEDKAKGKGLKVAEIANMGELVKQAMANPTRLADWKAQAEKAIADAQADDDDGLDFALKS